MPFAASQGCLCFVGCTKKSFLYQKPIFGKRIFPIGNNSWWHDCPGNDEYRSQNRQLQDAI